ncbi:MAG: hypothetical protein BGP09_24975 [Rhizobium sp. 60-20]|nr:MAG: hypothetical protein BGP09_24975 [Rhizobium sp. 60-20]
MNDALARAESAASLPTERSTGALLGGVALTLSLRAMFRTWRLKDGEIIGKLKLVKEPGLPPKLIDCAWSIDGELSNSALARAKGRRLSIMFIFTLIVLNPLITRQPR